MEPVARTRFLLHEKYKPRIVSYAGTLKISLNGLALNATDAAPMAHVSTSPEYYNDVQEGPVWLHALCHRPHDDP
jgi:hypothetical protein